MSGKIFINYRRGEDSDSAGRLYDRLEHAFPRDQLFMDVDSIPPGHDFVSVLEEQVAQCGVFLAVIGRGWSDAIQRLNNPDDFVRIEIESALKQDKLVIPVLVHEARMPRLDELPEAIRPLATRNAVRLTHERFKADTQGLIKAIQQALGEAGSAVLQPAEPIRTFAGHTGDVNSVAFSPDGRTALSGSRDWTLKLWEVATGKELRTFKGHSREVWSVAFSPDGRTALSGSDDYTLMLWDVVTGKELRIFTVLTNIPASVRSVAFSPDGLTALSGGDDWLKLWEVATGKELRTFRGHARHVRSVAFSPDGRTALSGSDDTTLKLWDVAMGKDLRTFTRHFKAVESVAFSPDGRTAMSGSDDQWLKLWDVATGKELRTFQGHSSWVLSVAFSPDGRTALSGGLDSTLKLWEVATGKVLRTFAGHLGPVRSVAFSPDGLTALSGGDDDRTLKLWDLTGL